MSRFEYNINVHIETEEGATRSEAAWLQESIEDLITRGMSVMEIEKISVRVNRIEEHFNPEDGER